MNTKNITLSILFLVQTNTIFSQEFLKEVGNISYITSENDAIITRTYIVKNTSKEDLWVWFNSAKSLDHAKNVNNYFYTRKDEISLFEILNDESVKNKSLSIIGQTFIKLIHPKECFKIYLVNMKTGNCSDNLLESTLMTVGSSQFKKHLLTSLDRNSEYCYPSNFIILDCSILSAM